MSMISVSNLTFAYDGSYDDIFTNVSFTIDTDWKLGFIGRNGKGKTTFLKLLMGQHQYKGSITATVHFDYFPFAVEDEYDDVMTIAQNVSGCEPWQLRKELNLLEVKEDVLYRPFCTLSGGEKTKVLLAALFLKDNNFLLIDEPTNHLDSHARAVLGKYLNGKHGFILVSHDRVFVDSCVDHILSINRSDIEIQQGNFSTWQRNREMQDGFEQAESDKLKKDIKRLEKAARQTANWSDKVESSKKGQRVAGLRPDRGHIGAMAAKMMKRSKVTEGHRQKAVEEKSKLLKNVEEVDRLFFRPLEFHTDILVRAEELSIAYGEREVVSGLDFEVRRGERIALTGRNGCGKSSVLKLIVGEDVPHTGSLRLGSGLKVSYVSQDTSFLVGGMDDFVHEHGLDQSLFKALLRKLDFERTQFGKNLDDLSEGQKKKVLIAKSLCEQAHLYIWDEPLNYIDVLSRMQIEAAIAESQPTMLFVEHDISFARELATKEIRL